MHLTSITHRRQLFDLATRWFADCPHREDGRFLTKAFTYEDVITAPVVRSLLMGIKDAVHPEPIRLERLRSKDELRDAILRTCKDPTPREAELFAMYRQRPEEYFPGTPTDVLMAYREDGSILGMARVKRLRRIAEKCSRRVADRLAGAIQDRARALAQRRADRFKVPLKQLVSSEGEMAEDFSTAERVISRTFRDGIVVFQPQDLRIDDGIGIKFVGTPEELEEIEQAIRQHPLLASFEREEHRGTYNDINLLLDLRLPDPLETLARERHRDWTPLEGRGLSAAQLAAEFPDYVVGGESTFRVEVILTTREDLVESEFGAAIHEARILDQRQAYVGRIASNASFLIEYMLMLALSPTLELRELPVKMWGRYLPDVYSIAVWKLWGISLGRDQLDGLQLWDMPPALAVRA